MYTHVQIAVEIQFYWPSPQIQPYNPYYIMANNMELEPTHVPVFSGFLHAIVACKRISSVNLNTVAAPKGLLEQLTAATVGSLVKVAYAATCPAIGNVRVVTKVIVVAVRWSGI